MLAFAYTEVGKMLCSFLNGYITEHKEAYETAKKRFIDEAEERAEEERLNAEEAALKAKREELNRKKREREEAAAGSA